MGLLGSKKKIYVSSVVYNLAGDENLRPDYLKSLVLGNIISAVDFDVAETIQSGYIRGPGIKFRNFFRWAQNNYDLVGVPKGGMVNVGDLDNSIIAEHIPSDPGDAVQISDAVFDVADYFYWADQWMYDNHKDLHETEWVSDYDDATGEVVITFEDTSTARFTPSDFDAAASYIFATYSITGAGSSGPILPGSPTAGPFPDITGWTEITNVVTPHTQTLNKVTTTAITYSDGSPGSTNTVPSSSTEDWDEIHATYEKEVYQGQDPLVDRLWSLKSYMALDQTSHVVSVTTTGTVNEDMGGGVIKTTVTTVVEDTLVLDPVSQIDTQDITIQTFDGPHVFIYKIGSGIPELDDMISIEAPVEQYFPFIPARLDNQFILEDEGPYQDAYPIVKKAFKKATGGKYDDFIEKVKDNEKLSDIDYTYAMFAVSLNVKENDCRDYLWRFFSKLKDQQSTGGTAYATWKATNATYTAAQLAYDDWKAAQAIESDPLFGTPEPAVPAYPAMPTNEVAIKSSGELATNLDMRITWQSIEETSGSGLKEPERKKGEFWFTNGTTETMFSGRKLVKADICYLNWQVTDTLWKSLKLTGMVHRNYIYKGKYVEIGTKEALEDTDESGFLVPLHFDTWKTMPLTKSTQMATACTFAVFNCYVVKKLKWYQTGIFKILLIVVVIAISIYFPPFGAAGGGILGGGAAVGAALGFTGAIGLIVGAVANFIAATLLMKIISIGATTIFGDKIGAIIAAVVSVVAITVGTGMMNGGSFASSVGQLSRIDNILNLANSVGGGIQQYVAASIKEIGSKMATAVEQYEKESSNLSDLYAQNIGSGRASFDAMNLTGYQSYAPESRELFLSRTLLTGSDNIQMTLGFVTNFADVTLSTKLP